MNINDKIARVQELLKLFNIDGWLLYDFRRSNPLALKVLEIPHGQLLTRRFFYYVVQSGSPIKIVSSVENPLKYLPGRTEVYHSWQELHTLLKAHIKGKVAMEYSPFGATPEVSKVDGGTIDLIRSFGVEVVSSGDLLQEFTSLLTKEKLESHKRAANFLDKLAAKTWKWIKDQYEGRHPITEFDVQKFMLKEMEKNGFTTDHPPICAVNEHSADPHYSPEMESSSPIKKGDFILIDLWCKENHPGAVYGDITRVGILDNKVQEEIEKVFLVVKKARDAAFGFIKKRLVDGASIMGFEIDRVCRDVIESEGYGSDFLHRTGHNIEESDHGPGAHLDDLETHDTRHILPRSCFSIEPGIYLKGKFGVRLECDVYISENYEMIVTGGVQKEVERLLIS